MTDYTLKAETGVYDHKGGALGGPRRAEQPPTEQPPPTPTPPDTPPEPVKEPPDGNV